MPEDMLVKLWRAIARIGMTGICTIIPGNLDAVRPAADIEAAREIAEQQEKSPDAVPGKVTARPRPGETSRG